MNWSCTWYEQGYGIRTICTWCLQKTFFYVVIPLPLFCCCCCDFSVLSYINVSTVPLCVFQHIIVLSLDIFTNREQVWAFDFILTQYQSEIVIHGHILRHFALIVFTTMCFVNQLSKKQVTKQGQKRGYNRRLRGSTCNAIVSKQDYLMRKMTLMLRRWLCHTATTLLDTGRKCP